MSELGAGRGRSLLLLLGDLPAHLGDIGSGFKHLHFADHDFAVSNRNGVALHSRIGPIGVVVRCDVTA
jgi:hypothetical protein